MSITLAAASWVAPELNNTNNGIVMRSNKIVLRVMMTFQWQAIGAATRSNSKIIVANRCLFIFVRCWASALSVSPTPPPPPLPSLWDSSYSYTNCVVGPFKWIKISLWWYHFIFIVIAPRAVNTGPNSFVGDGLIFDDTTTTTMRLFNGKYKNKKTKKKKKNVLMSPIVSMSSRLALSWYL